MSYRVTDDSRGDWRRNIVSRRESVDLFRDLVERPEDARVLVRHELETKPAADPQPIISRPFEDASTYDPIANAIQWPFDHPAASRFSAGSYGVWYGARTLEGSICETAHHFRRNTLASEIARSSKTPIYQERRVHMVRCSAALVDLRELCADDSRLVDPANYAHCQALGSELRAAFLPGVITLSARLANEQIVGVFVREALSDPRDVCYLTYALDAQSGRVFVERTPGRVDWVIE